EFIKYIQHKKILGATTLKIMYGTILLLYGGTAWVQAGVWKDTESLFLHANKVTKNNYIADSSLALYYLGKHENTKAWEYYQLARKVEPKYATLYTAITYELLKQNKYSAVVLVNRQMIQAGVRVEDGYRIIGQVLLNAKKYKKSISSFQQALDLNPEDYYCLYGIGYAYYKIQKYDLALSYLHRIETTQYKETKLMQLFGDIYMRKGNNKLANYYYSLRDKNK
ncbi:MAG: tetratricopeptide repeat protein, partial [Gammaproteobacteria bacterium]